MSHSLSPSCICGHNVLRVLALACMSKAKPALDMQDKCHHEFFSAPKNVKSSSADWWNGFFFPPNFMQGIAMLTTPTLSVMWAWSKKSAALCISGESASSSQSQFPSCSVGVPPPQEKLDLLRASFISLSSNFHLQIFQHNYMQTFTFHSKALPCPQTAARYITPRETQHAINAHFLCFLDCSRGTDKLKICDYKLS